METEEIVAIQDMRNEITIEKKTTLRSKEIV
jgi:hypothetical protein